MEMIRPIKFIPATKEYIWGGTTLKEKWGKVSETETIAECWELSSFPGAESVDAESGDPLSLIIKEHPEYFCGKVSGENFPILVKLIDARDNLSIQVHPSDEYAYENENGSQGKTEMWYIADAEPNACIYYGFSRKVSEREVARRISSGTITNVLKKIPVKKGDAFFVPAGTVHALLSGVTVIEVQQNSNITYRVYDYERTDKYGNPRELHINKALDVMNFSKYSIEDPSPFMPLGVGVMARPLAVCKYFFTEEVKFKDAIGYKIAPKYNFITFTVADGCGKFADGREIKKGDTWLIPCGAETSITAAAMTLVLTNV